MTSTPKPGTTTAFHAQAGVSFAVATCAVLQGIWFVPVDP